MNASCETFTTGQDDWTNLLTKSFRHGINMLREVSRTADRRLTYTVFFCNRFRTLLSRVLILSTLLPRSVTAISAK